MSNKTAWRIKRSGLRKVNPLEDQPEMFVVQEPDGGSLGVLQAQVKLEKWYSNVWEQVVW